MQLYRRRKKCACGRCGLYVKPGNTYIKGHSRKGKKYPISEERRVALQLFYSSPEEREKQSILQKEAQNRPEVREKKSKAMKKICNTPEARKRNSIAQNKPSTRKKRSDSLIKANKRPEVIENRSRAAVIACNRPERKAKCSKIMKEKWKDSEFVKKQMKAKYVRQNKQEKYLEDVLNDLYPNEYKFVGDGEVIIGGCCPDFVNINGQKKIIEFFGDYWHRNDLRGSRERFFAKYGYDTLVVWGKELKDMEMVKFRIHRFNKSCR